MCSEFLCVRACVRACAPAVTGPGGAGSDLCSARTLQNVDQRRGHLLLVLHADDRFQHRAQLPVVVGDELGKLLVLLHGKDEDGLEARLDADGRAPSFGLADGGRADRVPLLHELSPRHICHRDVDQAHIVVLVFLLLLLVHIMVDVDSDVLCSGQAGEEEELPPEQAVVACLAGGPSMENVIQAQLTEISLLWEQVFCLNDPQSQQVLRPPTVVLQTIALKKTAMKVKVT